MAAPRCACVEGGTSPSEDPPVPPRVFWGAPWGRGSVASLASATTCSSSAKAFGSAGCWGEGGAAKRPWATGARCPGTMPAVTWHDASCDRRQLSSAFPAPEMNAQQYQP